MGINVICGCGYDGTIAHKLYADEAALMNETVNRIRGQQEAIAELEYGNSYDIDIESEDGRIIVELNRKILADLYELANMQNEIIKTISALDSVREQAVIFYRYLRKMSWQDIATELGVTVNLVKRWYIGGLHEIDIPGNDAED